MQKKVLAVHDISCVGRCSLTIIIPIIACAGHECSPLPTAVLSTHPGGFKNFNFRDLSSDIDPTRIHWNSLGLKFDAIYSGFLGSYEQIEMTQRLFTDLSNKDTLIVVDPVMADHGKVYSVYNDKMVDGMKKLCGMANIIVPNLTEAAFLSGEKYIGDGYSEEYILNTAKKLAKLGTDKIIITGVSFDNESTGVFYYDSKKDESVYISGKKIDGDYHGAGDIFASALISGILKGKNINDSAKIAIDFVSVAIEYTKTQNTEKRYGIAFEPVIPTLLERLFT